VIAGQAFLDAGAIRADGATAAAKLLLEAVTGSG
jgi:hypothetical protein